MSATLKQLEERLATVEREVAALRKQVAGKRPKKRPTGKPRPKSLLKLADESHAEVVAASREALAEMGIEGKPIGAEKLQERMAESGIDAASNWLTGEMIELRNRTRP
jgi:hypothetical protein